MRPPICYICGKRFGKVVLIDFKKRKADIRWVKKMKKQKSIEHPPYAEWFCEDHYDEAYKVRHLPINKALKLLKSM